MDLSARIDAAVARAISIGQGGIAPAKLSAALDYASQQLAQADAAPAHQFARDDEERDREEMVRLDAANEIEEQRLERIAQFEDEDRDDGGQQDRPDQRHAEKDRAEKHEDDEEEDKMIEKKAIKFFLESDIGSPDLKSISQGNNGFI
mgnify:CR=1 FL=1